MNTVKMIRVTVGLKQYRLAEQLGLDQSNFANIENGKSIPNNLDSIKSRALGILLPLLDLKIKSKELEIKHLKTLREYAVK